MTPDLRALLQEIHGRGIRLTYCSQHGVHSVRGRGLTKKLRAEIERRKWSLCFWFAMAEEELTCM